GLTRLVDPVDDLEFRIALPELDRKVELRRKGSALSLNIGERLVPIDVRLALAEKIQVRTVENVDGATHRTSPRKALGWRSRGREFYRSPPCRPGPRWDHRGL